MGIADALYGICTSGGVRVELRALYPDPSFGYKLSSGYRVVSSNGLTLAWIYSADGIARSADPHKLTHEEALAMAKAIAALN